MSERKFGSRKVAALAVAGLVLVLSWDAAATVMVRLDLEKLTAVSDDVVLGRVLYSFSYRSEAQSRIFTETHIAVDRYLKSSWKVGSGSPYIRVRQPGGVVGSLATWVPGVATFQANEWVVIFLRLDPNNRYQVVGLGQGKFTIDQDAEGKSIVKGSAAPVPSVFGNTDAVSAPAEEDGAESISLESFERRVRGLAAIQRAMERPGPERGKAKGRR